MDRLFGTDGIRGVPGEYPLTDGMIFKLAKATAYLLHSQKTHNEPPGRKLKVIVGKDTRSSGQRMEVVFLNGISSCGIDALLAGTIPTAGLAFLAKELKAGIGVMLSASHNRAEENGIKFFSGDGYKLSRLQEELIEELIFTNFRDSDLSSYGNGSICRVEDAQKKYVNFVKSTVTRLRLSGLKIVLDCAYGALSETAPRVFNDLGAQIISVNDRPNGMNINLNCGALHPEKTAKLVTSHKADAGFCFDGDGDRLIIVDNKGNILDGDYIMAIIGSYLLEKNKLPGRALVSTVMSNYGLQKAIEEAGGKVISTDVGDRCVVDECLRNNLSFGGEQSGHIVFLEHSTTGDALISALQIIKVMKESGKPLSELSQRMRKLPQVLINIKVREKKPLADMPAVSEVISRSQSRLEGSGRLLVRYSGTEPVARVMVEGENKNFIEGIGNSVAAAIEEEIG